MVIDDSQRLKFSLINLNDAQFLFELDQSSEVMRYINGGIPSSKDEINDIFLPRLAKFTHSERGWGLWKVVEKGIDKPIGWILIRPMGFFSNEAQWTNLEIGWRFKQDVWGNGYATEAAEQVMKAISLQGLVEKFSAIAMPANTPSINIMKKLGMVYSDTYEHSDHRGSVTVVRYELVVNK